MDTSLPKYIYTEGLWKWLSTARAPQRTPVIEHPFPPPCVSPVLSLEPLLELLLTQDGVLPPQSLLKAQLSLQSLLVAEH